MINLQLTLKIWRQKSSSEKGAFETYDVKGLNSHKNQLPLIMIVEKAYAECVPWLSMVGHTVL